VRAVCEGADGGCGLEKESEIERKWMRKWIGSN
jgi:hypothetical protein